MYLDRDWKYLHLQLNIFFPSPHCLSKRLYVHVHSLGNLLCALSRRLHRERLFGPLAGEDDYRSLDGHLKAEWAKRLRLTRLTLTYT